MDRLVSASIGLLFIFALLAPATLVVTPATAPFATTTTPATSPAAGSLYSLDLQLETAAGSHIGTGALVGKPRVATMFYAHCQSMCPLAIQTLKELDRRLSPGERMALGYVLLSLDPQRDAPESLHERAQSEALDPSRWVLARTAPTDVGRAADSLGIRWRPLANGEVDHGGALVLLDAQGRELSRTTSIAAVDARFLKEVRAAVGGSVVP
jgi:protein SCO1